MTHGDDDGLRLPPRIAPQQVVIVPMLREKPEDAEVLAYCEKLKAELDGLVAFGQPLRAKLDKKAARAATKRWDWVRRGAPVILEVGPRDAASDKVTMIRRDKLYEGEKVRSELLHARSLQGKCCGTAHGNSGKSLRRGQGAARRQYPLRPAEF